MKSFLYYRPKVISTPKNLQIYFQQVNNFMRINKQLTYIFFWLRKLLSTFDDIKYKAIRSTNFSKRAKRIDEKDIFKINSHK